MNQKKRQVIKPQYLKDFACIGSSCEDNCCIGWDVDIDRKTYRTYQKIKDPKLESMLKKHVHPKEYVSGDDIDYAGVTLTKSKRCPFLNEHKLCMIQATLGEEYLSNVCASYPRFTNEVNGTVEYSATVSCPEAARLILGNEKGIALLEEEEDMNQWHMIKYALDTQQHGNNMLVKYFLQLRSFSIWLIQNREYELWERLLLLGIFYEKLQEEKDKKNMQGVLPLIEYFRNKVEKKQYKKELAMAKTDEKIQKRMVKEFVDKLNVFTEIDSKPYITFTKECFQGMKSSYKQGYKEYYQPFMEQYGYMMENYLVNFIYEDLFPAAESEEPFESYLLLVIRYAFIKFHLIGLAHFYHGLTENLVREYIQVFAKVVEHHKTYLDELMNHIKEKGYQEMDYIEILLKNEV